MDFPVIHRKFIGTVHADRQIDEQISWAAAKKRCKRNLRMARVNCTYLLRIRIKLSL